MPDYFAEFQGEGNERGSNSIGLGGHLYLILEEDLETFATLTLDGSSAAADNEYSGAFVPKTGKAFAKIAINQAEITSESEGEEGSETMMFTLAAHSPGLGVRAAEMTKELNGKRVIVLVPDKDCDVPTYFVLGSQCEAAIIKTTQRTGKSRGGGGAKGTDLQVMYSDNNLKSYPLSLGIVTTPVP